MEQRQARRAERQGDTSVNIAGFYEESISNGEGWRAVLFVSGCPHHCPGCHNEKTWDYNYGEKFNKEEILEKIKDNFILQGVTVSGGEPLCPENIKEVTEFIKDVKALNLDVWCYTGYTFEELIKRDNTNEAMEYIDVLVDGRFETDKKIPNLKFRGSENQRIIDVKKSLLENRVIEYII